MVSNMKKSMNLFAHYTFSKIFKALILYVLFFVIPTITSVILLVNLSLVMLPYYTVILVLLTIVLVLINGYAWHVFISTLKAYATIDGFDYRMIFYIAFAATSVIVVVFTLGLGFAIF